MLHRYIYICLCAAQSLYKTSLEVIYFERRCAWVEPAPGQFQGQHHSHRALRAVQCIRRHKPGSSRASRVAVLIQHQGPKRPLPALFERGYAGAARCSHHAFQKPEHKRASVFRCPLQDLVDEIFKTALFRGPCAILNRNEASPPTHTHTQRRDFVAT